MRAGVWLVVGLAVGFGAGALWFDRPAWDGFYYPDRSSLRESVYLGKFRELAECRSAARARLGRYRVAVLRNPDLPEPDYECGYRCRPLDNSGMAICDRTER